MGAKRPPSSCLAKRGRGTARQRGGRGDGKDDAHRASGRSARPPPPSFAWFPSPAALRSAGADEQHRSRDATRARVLRNDLVGWAKARSAVPTRNSQKLKSAWASLRSAPPYKNRKEKREAERRQTCVQPPRPCGRGAHRRVRSPVGVPPRLLRQRANANAQLQARLPGTRQDARSGKLAPTGERRPRAVPRALPAPACPSPGNAPPRPVIVPAG